MRRRTAVPWSISGPADLRDAIDTAAAAADLTRRQWVIRACRAALAGTTALAPPPPPVPPPPLASDGPIRFTDD